MPFLSMQKSLKASLPSPFIVLISITSFTSLSSISAWQSYNRHMNAGLDVTYLERWLYFIPWWGHWIWIAPLLIARIQNLPYLGSKRMEMVWQQFFMFVVGLGIYWLATISTVGLIQAGNVDFNTLVYVAGFVMNGPFHFDMMIYVCVVCLGFVRLFDQYVMSEQARNKALSHQLIQTQLESLRAQLNPHFLFNTLNSICSLIRQHDEQSSLKALSELSLMLRKVLENRSKHLVTVGQELAFTRSYLNIQKMRFGDKLDEKITVAEQCKELEIPFMLLQPLLENAVQHSSQLASDSNPVHVTIEFDEPFLVITLVNRPADDSNHQGFGIGIDNCRQRLQRIYGDDFVLRLDHQGALFTTQIKIPAGD